MQNPGALLLMWFGWFIDIPQIPSLIAGQNQRAAHHGDVAVMVCRLLLPARPQIKA